MPIILQILGVSLGLYFLFKSLIYIIKPNRGKQWTIAPAKLINIEIDEKSNDDLVLDEHHFDDHVRNPPTLYRMKILYEFVVDGRVFKGSNRGSSFGSSWYSSKQRVQNQIARIEKRSRENTFFVYHLNEPRQNTTHPDLPWFWIAQVLFGLVFVFGTLFARTFF